MLLSSHESTNKEIDTFCATCHCTDFRILPLFTRIFRSLYDQSGDPSIIFNFSTPFSIHLWWANTIFCWHYKPQTKRVEVDLYIWQIVTGAIVAELNCFICVSGISGVCLMGTLYLFPMWFLETFFSILCHYYICSDEAIIWAVFLIGYFRMR